MPEVAEVAHVVAQLRRHILGYQIKNLNLPFDLLLFPQAKRAPQPDITLQQYTSLLHHATIQNVGRHGKYFWIRTETQKHETAVILLHFGMTGMVKLRGIESHLIMMENGGDKVVQRQIMQDLGDDSKQEIKFKQVPLEGVADGVKVEAVTIEETPKAEVSESFSNHFASVSNTQDWPPRFTKFQLFLEDPDTKKTIDFAFTDPRRLGRVQVLSGSEFQTNSGLLESSETLRKLGPDYSKAAGAAAAEKLPDPVVTFGDPDPGHHGKPRLEFPEFARLVLSKKKPIKALLLDQQFFAGVGNWVSDEILFQARIHPAEIISQKVSDPEDPVLRNLYDALIYVMEESVRLEGNARDFPSNWLMLHRWGKGRKSPRAKVSSGHSVDFETVGGRTACFVKDLQRPLGRKRHSEPKTGKESPEPGPKRSKKELSPKPEKSEKS